MGCCSLKKDCKKQSGLEYLTRLALFWIFNGTMLAMTFIRSVFDKRYRKIFAFYKRFYKKALDELE